MNRARARLDERSQESLFYAALELRTSIENRLRQYMEALDYITRKARKDHRIGRLGKRLEKAFRTGDRVAAVSFHRDDTGESIGVLYYTPVNSSLRKRAEKLGDVLHGLARHRPDDDPWWESLRESLEQTYSELVEAHRGELLGPPLLNKLGATVSLRAEIPEGHDLHGDWAKMKLAVGARLVVKVDYLKKHPGSE